MAFNTKITDFLNLCIKSEYTLSTPVLYTKNKSGKFRIWSSHIILIENVNQELEIKSGIWLQTIKKIQIPENINEINLPAITYTTYGTENGKLTISAPNIIHCGKNIGKINQTNPLQQAILEVYSDYTQHINKGANTNPNKLNICGYTELLANGRHRVNVMLLHDVSKGNWAKVHYPCYVQPKLDGIHLIAVAVHNKTPYIDLYSRGISKNIIQPHIVNALEVLKKEEWRGFYLTGELFLPNVNRQDTASLSLGENQQKNNIKLNFNVFDIFSVDKVLTFEERYILLVKIVQDINSEYVKLVKAKLVYNKSELDEYYNDCINKQYEGIVIRNVKGVYEYGISNEIRSFNTMKYKLRDDFEFEITGFKNGDGKFKNLIIFILKTTPEFIEKYCNNKGNIIEFSASPKWTEEQKKTALKNGNYYIGRKATVSFDSVSRDCVPIQPVLLQVH